MYPDAEKIILVMDNLNTHKPASLYKKYPAAEARRIIKRLEIHYTSKHGSWLDIAEIELNVMTRQCYHGELITFQNFVMNYPHGNANATPRLRRLIGSFELLMQE